ncbi:MAG: DUF6152 family protein [Pseudomonadota bacterium]
MRKPFRLYVCVFASVLVAPFALGHHSFAVHFVADKTVEVKGTVESFRFSNPHGILTFNTVDASGATVAWRAETNSPNVLRRRGWDRDALKPGDQITVTGFPARDGTSYMRISKVIFADGHELVGQAAPPTPEEEKD